MDNLSPLSISHAGRRNIITYFSWHIFRRDRISALIQWAKVPADHIFCVFWVINVAQRSWSECQRHLGLEMEQIICQSVLVLCWRKYNKSSIAAEDVSGEELGMQRNTTNAMCMSTTNYPQVVLNCIIIFKNSFVAMSLFGFFFSTKDALIPLHRAWTLPMLVCFAAAFHSFLSCLCW